MQRNIEHTKLVLFFSITFLFCVAACVDTEFDKIFYSSDTVPFSKYASLIVGCCGQGQKENAYSRLSSNCRT